MSKGWFITGTDTEIGKTTFSTQFLDYLVTTTNCSVGAYKPVASGMECIEGDWINHDVYQLRKHVNIEIDVKDMNPYSFFPAIAPHLAAKEAGVVISLETIAKHYQAISQRAEYVLVEGAGGILVPLNENHTMADICQYLSLSAIIVVGMRLGCINHALLTLESLLHRGITVSGWVANQIALDMTHYEGNKETLVNKMTVPLIAEIPYQPQGVSQINWSLPNGFMNI